MTEFLTATIFPPHSEEPDAEPVLLEADDKNVTLTLDAGEQLVYGGMMGDEVMRMVETFDAAGHSGFSAGMAASIFGRLSEWKPLTPITSNPDEWMHIEEGVAGNPVTWQNRRQSSCFSKDGGKTYYDIDERLTWWRRALRRVTKRPWLKYHRLVVP